MECPWDEVKGIKFDMPRDALSRENLALRDISTSYQFK